MGNKMHRSSSSRSEGSKTRLKRKKRKHLQDMETIREGETTIVSNNNNLDDTNGNLMIKPSEWTTTIELQQNIANSNDPPGAPSTFSSNFPMLQNDITQSWSPHYDTNNKFYNGNGISMPMNLSYDPNQYIQNTNIMLNQSQTISLEDNLQKKVQFAHPIQQQEPIKPPLTGTQSWHESSATNNGTSAKKESIPNRPSTHRSGVAKSTTKSSPAPVEKPIYVAIDHRATLAERGQTTAHHRQQKINTKNSSETVLNQKSSSHTHHHHQKHQESNDSPTIKNNTSKRKSLELLQNNQSNPPRQLTTTSTSTVIPTKQSSVIEHAIPNDNDLKISKNRSNRQSNEQQTSSDNDMKVSRPKSSRSQSKRQQQRQRTETNRNHSPVRNEPTRRIETKQPDSPAMRIPITKQRQKQPLPPITTTTSGNISRTRV